MTIEKAKRPKLRDRYQHKIGPLEMSLLEKLLELDPRKRLSADVALKSRYFFSDPIPPDRPEDLGPINVEGGHFHEFQTKKKRREAKAAAEKIRQTAMDGGHSEKEAQEFFDSTYREIMERVAREGLDVAADATNETTRGEKSGTSSRTFTREDELDESSKEDFRRDSRRRRSREKKRDKEDGHRRDRGEKRSKERSRGSSKDRNNEGEHRKRDRSKDKKSKRQESDDGHKRSRHSSEDRRRDRGRNKTSHNAASGKNDKITSPVSTRDEER